MSAVNDEEPLSVDSEISGNAKQSLIFEITSAHISEDDGPNKKYVVYTLQVRHIGGKEDSSPATIERRYTDFNNLHAALKKEYPDMMLTVSFPKKVLIGNFDNRLISLRSTGFESLLKHISTVSTLRSSQSLLSFLQDIELTKAKEYLEAKDYRNALPLLENNFRLLSKVYTDRSAAVLLALCRLLGCSMALPGCPNAVKWAQLALHRYEGVSDSDLLQLYMPLLQTCTQLWSEPDGHKQMLESRIKDLRMQGLRCGPNQNLLDAITELEDKLLNVL